MMFEYWAAGGNPPLDTCMERVDEADVLVVVVAHRYGWVPPSQDADPSDGGAESITWLECLRAEQQGKEVIPFLLDEAVEWPARSYESYRPQEAVTGGTDPAELPRLGEEILRNTRCLQDFKTWLDTRKVRNRFGNADELRGWVLHSLSEWKGRRGHAKPATDPYRRARYLDWLRHSCESVELPGLDPKETQNVRLRQVYVPAVTAAPMDKEEDKDRPPDPSRSEADRRQPLLTRLGQESLYVPGAPGAGKTTFCRWLALVTAGGTLPPHRIQAPEGFAETLPADLEGRFPVLCQLRK
jgi:hypothetical protein